jgi:threonyl-tRNA synthetase
LSVLPEASLRHDLHVYASIWLLLHILRASRFLDAREGVCTSPHETIGARQAQARAGKEWKLDPGEGAFYGPKIDITVYDALRRKFQCATVQLDFQTPIRFGLQYWTESQSAVRPVAVHRAILGSVERMYAILTEHYAQKWPLWLSPRQVMVVPISGAAHNYANAVRSELRAAKFFVEVDGRDQKMQKKVRAVTLCHAVPLLAKMLAEVPPCHVGSQIVWATV